MKNKIGNTLIPLRNASSNIMELTVTRDLDEHLLQSWERNIWLDKAQYVRRIWKFIRQYGIRVAVKNKVARQPKEKKTEHPGVYIDVGSPILQVFGLM